MRDYELMYIIRPEHDEEGTNAVIEKFSKLINDNNGEVVSADKWGKRRLAYEIRDYREGIYVLVHFKGEPSTADEVSRIMKITDDILRFLILRKGE